MHRARRRVGDKDIVSLYVYRASPDFGSSDRRVHLVMFDPVAKSQTNSVY